MTGSGIEYQHLRSLIVDKLYKGSTLLYDFPEYYEVAYSFRDIASEVDFLTRCIDSFSLINVRDVLEIACGPASHTGELIRRGFNYSGIDINRHMIDYAYRKWCTLQPTPELFEADMVAFEHPRQVDFAFVMLGSLYLNSDEQMTDHFNSVARVLRPGGLYFLDWCIQFSDPLKHRTDNTYVIESKGIKIKSNFKIEPIDTDRQMYEEVWTVHIEDQGQPRAFEMVERNRAILPTEFIKFIDTHRDFELIGWWREWDLDKPIENGIIPNRPVTLLRRVD